MPNYNRTILMGNLTRDPELQYLPSGTPVCKLGLAVNRRYKDRQSGEDREEVLFIDVNFFGPRAEVVNQYFSKGKPIHIEGRLRLEQWEAEDGTNRSRHTVTADSFEFVESGDGSGNGNGNSNYNSGGQQAAAAPAGQQAGESVDDDNVPF